MGNSPSSSSSSGPGEGGGGGRGSSSSMMNNMDSFPGSAIVDALQCGGILDDPSEYNNGNNDQQQRRDRRHRRSHSRSRNGNDPVSTFLARTDELCNMSPQHSPHRGFGVGVGGANGTGRGSSGDGGGHPMWKTQSDFNDEYEEFGVSPRNNDAVVNDENQNQQNDVGHDDGKDNDPATASSTLFAKALVNEVTDNPKTMTPQAMAERERKLLKAQERARQMSKAGNSGTASAGGIGGPASGQTVRPVGTPGAGVGKPSVLGSIAHALGANSTALSDNGGTTTPSSMKHRPSIVPPNILSENRAVAQAASGSSLASPLGRHTVTIGLSLSRRSFEGHPDTVTRQTAFDFNELQDREYKYVSSTDPSGWRAGGGESGVSSIGTNMGKDDGTNPENMSSPQQQSFNHPGTPLDSTQQDPKIPSPDTVHIPIIHINAGCQENVDVIISALARGEVFIPHMAIIPESLSVNGVSPPDLVVRFGTERNEDLPPDEWPNWCIEFIHNQLYEIFHGMGAHWMPRPFSITLAKKVRWKTVKHMNRYFAHAERVIDAWREKGPQYLDPQLSYVDGGATPEEVARPHGIYLFQNGIPTNYFAPNFDPPYTTKMTRSLLFNVLGKSWDKRRREWSSEPIPRLVTPSMLVSAMFGCNESQVGGFIATEATTQQAYMQNSDGIAETTLPEESNIRTYEQDTFVAATRNDKLQEEEGQRQEDMNNYQADQYQADEYQPDQYEEPQYHEEYENIGGIGGTPRNASPAGIDLPTLSSASGVPSPDYAHETSDNDYAADRMMAHADERPSYVEESYDVHKQTPMKVTTNFNIVNPASSSDDESQKESKSAISSSSPHSLKYGRPPTPESIVSPHQNASSANDRIMEKLGNDFHHHGIEDVDDENVDPTKKNVMNVGTPLPVDPPSARELTSKEVASPKTGSSREPIACIIDAEQEHSTKRDPEPDQESTGNDEKNPELLACDEDWLEFVEHSERSSRQIKEIENANAKPTYSAKRQRVKEALERERQRQIEIIAVAQEKSSVGSNLEKSLKHPEKKKPRDPSMEDSRRSPSLRKNYSGTSGVSLEYSIDSAGNTIGESTVGSSLMGQHIETGTVASGFTKEPKGNHGASQDALPEVNPSVEESHGSSLLSTQDSDETIPSDEELFKVGWAKALDSNSGSYYYFTLDRSKIVWDNPLAPPSQSEDESTMGGLDDEEQIPRSAAVI